MIVSLLWTVRAVNLNSTLQVLMRTYLWCYWLYIQLPKICPVSWNCLSERKTRAEASSLRRGCQLKLLPLFKFAQVRGAVRKRGDRETGGNKKWFEIDLCALLARSYFETHSQKMGWDGKKRWTRHVRLGRVGRWMCIWWSVPWMVTVVPKLAKLRVSSGGSE